MKTEGSGGRTMTSATGNEADVLKGVLTTDDEVPPAGSKKRACANRRCENVFTSRQDGDNYCCQACEFDDNPNYKARRGYGD
jgi:hypothetical protein